MQGSLPQLILPIKLERSPERLTSLGGLVVLEELARAAGVDPCVGCNWRNQRRGPREQVDHDRRSLFHRYLKKAEAEKSKVNP